MWYKRTSTIIIFISGNHRIYAKQLSCSRLKGCSRAHQETSSKPGRLRPPKNKQCISDPTQCKYLGHVCVPPSFNLTAKKKVLSLCALPRLHPICVTSSDVSQLHNTGCQWVIDMTSMGLSSLVTETHPFHCNVFLEATFKKSYSCESSKEGGQYIHPCKFGTN